MWAITPDIGGMRLGPGHRTVHHPASELGRLRAYANEVSLGPSAPTKDAWNRLLGACGCGRIPVPSLAGQGGLPLTNWDTMPSSGQLVPILSRCGSERENHEPEETWAIAGERATRIELA